MAEKKFVVFFKDGTTQPITAESGDEDEETDGYVFFVDSTGGIAGLFHKEAVHSWREDSDQS
jgi:hypothetical protein